MSAQPPRISRLPVAADLHDPARRERRVQVEAWEDGARAHLLLVAQGPARTQAWLVTHDAGEDAWTGLCAELHPCPSHHDRAAVLAGFRQRPLVSQDMEIAGLLPGAPGLADAAAGVLAPPPPARLSYATGMGKTAALEQMMRGQGRITRLQDAEIAHQALVEPAALGYRSPGTGHLFAAIPGFRLHAPGSGTRPAGVVALPCDGTPPAPQVAALLDPAVAWLRTRLDAAVTEATGSRHWAPLAHAFYGCPGRRGERRRQAARLYPALSPVIARSGAVAERIDAGRPFEDLLCAALAPVHAQAPSAAALRRLRALPRDLPYPPLERALRAALFLPLDWLPRDGAALVAMAGHVAPYAVPAERLGLRLPDVVGFARGRWDMLSPGLESGTPEGPDLDSLEAALEMAERFRDTMVRPLLASAGLDTPDATGTRIAGSALFGGKGLPGIHRLQESWHAGLDALEAGLPAAGGPSGLEGQRWPAAFAPYETRGGIEVACLTNDAQLRAEGLAGLDADGVRGLDHCVGGYGRRCFSGESVVASIRRRTPGGGIERLATAEFRPDSWLRMLQVVQVFGRGNGPAPKVAIQALDALSRAFGEERLAVAPEAFERRDPDGYRDAYDWRVPGALGQAFAAWAPYLPRDVAAAGHGALRDRACAAARAAGPVGPVPMVGPEDAGLAHHDMDGLQDRIARLMGGAFGG